MLTKPQMQELSKNDSIVSRSEERRKLTLETVLVSGAILISCRTYSTKSLVQGCLGRRQGSGAQRTHGKNSYD